MNADGDRNTNNISSKRNRKSKRDAIVVSSGNSVLTQVKNAQNKNDHNSSQSSSSSSSSDSTSTNQGQGDSTSSSSTSSTSSKENSGSTTTSSSTSSGSGVQKRRKKIKKRRNWFDKIMKSSPEEHKFLKAVLWFPFGVAISALLYYLIWSRLDMDAKTRILVGGALGLFIALAFAFSVTMRCVMCLVLPTFVGKAGRSYLAAFAVIYLISGPISNIVANAKEVVRSLSCTSELLANHTKEKWKLRLHPVEGAIGDLTKDGFLLDRISKQIEKAFAPLKKEVNKNKEEEEELEEEIKHVEKLSESHEKTVEKVEKKHARDEELDDKAKRTEREWEKKLDLRCQDTFSKGVIRCREKMGELESKCMDTLSIIGHLVCWPLKITVFCQIVKLLPGVIGMDCNSMDVMPEGFGQTFNDANEVIDDMDQGMQVRMQYKVVNSDSDVDYTPALELRQAAVHEMDQKSLVVETLLNIISIVLTFTFLRVFKAAYAYNSQYLRNLTFDNIYITRYFRHIDARRRAQVKKTLLPLKKKERSQLLYPSKITLTKSEKASWSKGTGLLMFRVIVSAIIVYMDSLVYQILDIISRNSHVEYHQEGEHTVDIKIYGKGFMSGLVQSFLTKFNSKHTLDSITSNQECLPVPSKTDDVIVGFIFFAYLMVWIFMYFQGFGLRLRRPIAAFFYRKREKKRVLYLYNKTYRTRIGYLRHMRFKIRRQIRERTFKLKVGVIASLQKTFPRMCGFLRICKRTKPSCIICEESKEENLYHCPTKGCGVSYCKECWKDVKRRCLACGQNDDDVGEDSSDFSDLSDPSSDSDSD